MPETHTVFLGATPEVDASCVAGNVKHGNALQAGQGNGNPVALEESGEKR